MFKSKREEIYDRIKYNWNPPHVIVFNDDFSIRAIYDKTKPVKVCHNSAGNYLSAYGMDIYNVKCTTIYKNTPGFEDLSTVEEREDKFVKQTNLFSLFYLIKDKYFKPIG